MWLEANIELQEICTRCFWQVLACSQKASNWLTGQLRTQVLTGFSFLTIRHNLDQNHRYAVWLGANCEQQHCCARCFGQVLAFWEMSPISRKTTVAQCDLGPILSNRKVVHGVLHKIWLLHNTAQFGAKRQLRSVTCGQLRATALLRTVFWTSFSFLRNVAHFKQNDCCAECFDANLEQQDNWARLLDKY